MVKINIESIFIVLPNEREPKCDNASNNAFRSSVNAFLRLKAVPSQLFQYYMLDPKGFEPNVLTSRIPGLNETAMLTVTGANCELPDIGIARIIDPETGQTFEVDTSSSNVRETYAERVAAEREARKHLLRRLAIDEVAVRTEGGVVEPLLRFFRARETRARRR